jgi:hypothetical protein
MPQRIVVCVLLLLTTPSAARASLEWSSQPYQRVSQAQTNGDQTVVGADAQGNAVLAWREAAGNDYGIRVATRAPGGYFSRGAFPGNPFVALAGYVSGPGAAKPRVAVAADGSAMVVWDRLVQSDPSVIRAVEGRYRSQLGEWGPVETIAQGNGPIGADVAIDPRGNVTVAYIENSTIRARYRAANGTYEPAATLFTISQAQPNPLLFPPLVAMDGAGNALVAWGDAPTSSTYPNVYATEARSAQRPAGGSWEPDKLLTKLQSFETLLLISDVALHDGTAVVMVTRGTGPAAELYTRPAGQPDFAVTKLYEFGSYVTEGGGVTFDLDGNALAVVGRRYGSGGKTVASSYRPAGGSWGALTDASGTPSPYKVTTPGVDEAGNFTVAWTSPVENEDRVLYAATRPPGADGAFDAPQAVSEPRPAGEPAGPIGDPDLAVSGQGQAVVAWHHTDGEALRVEAGFGTVVGQSPVAQEPPPPPKPPFASAITLARPLATGKATILTLDVSGPVDRLKWEVPDAPAVYGDVVNGVLQKSVRVRTPSGPFKVTATASGPGGSTTFTRSFAGVNRATDDAARRVDISSGAARVVAVGSASVLMNKSTFCGDVTIYARSQRYSGCFKPIDSIDDIPTAERGVLSVLAQAVGVSASDAVTVNRAVELTDGYIATGPMLINGRWSVVPRGSAKLVSYPQAEVLASSAASFRVGGRLFTPGEGFVFPLDPDSGTTIDLGALSAPRDFTIGGFGVRGDVTIKLGRAEADVRADMRLPAFIEPISYGLDYTVVVPQRLRASPDGFYSLDGLTVGPLNVNVQLTPMTNLKLTYSETTGTWTGGGTACLLGVLICSGLNPCAADIACFDLQPPYGGLRIRGDKLEYMGVSRTFPAPGKVVAPGAFLERLDVGIKENPARFLGGARIGVGPLVKVDGKAVIAFPSDRAPWYPSRDELPNLPTKLYTTPFTNIAIGASADVILPLPLIGDTRLGGGYLLYEFPGYVAAGGGADFTVGPIHMIGVVSGEYDVLSQTYNLHGDIRACLGTKICSGAIGNISRGPNNAGGAGACISVGPVSVGGGYQWARATPLVWPLDGCKWSRFKLDVKKTARAAQVGGPTIIEVKKGQPNPAVEFTGAGAAPKLRVSGPAGTLESTDKGLDFTPDGTIRIIRFEENGTTVTVVGLQDAKPGSYTVEPLEGSAPITQVMTAADSADASVVGKVTGTGNRRTLRYSVAARPGQSVTFYDVTGGDAGKALRTVAGGKGKVSWSPAPGRVVHTVVARVTLDGIPAAEKRVARFKPPPPTLPTPGRLKLKRSGKSKLTVSWRRVGEATNYQIAILKSSGGTTTRLTRATRLTLRGVPRSASGKVAVVALAPLRHSKAATKPFKRTTRESSRFSGLKKCRVSKKKLVCRRA